MTKREIFEMKVETTSYGRFYQIEDIWLPSVTTVLKYGFPVSPGLIQWLKNQPSAEEADRIRDEAGARGELTHKTIEALLNQGNVNLTGLPDDVAKMVIGCTNWFTEFVDEVIEIEATLSDSKTAGRVDAIVKLKDGALAVVDFKSSKTISESYHAQVAQYVKMYCDAKQIPLIRGQILHLKPLTKKGFQVVDVDVHQGITAFDHAYALYKYLDLPLAPKERPKLPEMVYINLDKKPQI